MVKEGEESEFLRPSYTILDEAKDADAKLLNQKKEPKAETKSWEEKRRSIGNWKTERAEEEKWKEPKLRSSQEKIVQKDMENVCSYIDLHL